MKRFATMMLAVLLATPALAQQAGSNSNSNSGAMSSSGVNIRYGNGHKGTGAAIAPGLIASGLSCQGSVSTGAGGAGWGFAFGITKMDRDCNTRENAKIVGLTGDVPASKEVMCTIREVRDAYAMVGRPCLRDRIARTRTATRAVTTTGSIRSTREPRRDVWKIVRDR